MAETVTRTDPLTPKELDHLTRLAERANGKPFGTPDGWALIYAMLPSTVLRLLKQARNTEWQPIETAPKDGRDVLVWAAGWDNMCVLSWQPERDRWDDGSGDGYQDYQPTNWLPTTKPPQ